MKLLSLPIRLTMYDLLLATRRTVSIIQKAVPAITLLVTSLPILRWLSHSRFTASIPSLDPSLLSLRRDLLVSRLKSPSSASCSTRSHSSMREFLTFVSMSADMASFTPESVSNHSANASEYDAAGKYGCST